MLQCNVKDCGISEWEGAERNGTLFSPENLLGIIIGCGSLGHVDIWNPYVGNVRIQRPHAVETLLEYVGGYELCFAFDDINIRWIM
jgi:hypothetical protein